MTINQDSTNDLVFFAKSGLATPYFLVQLTSEINKVTFEFIVTDLAVCSFIIATMSEPGYSGVNDAVNGVLKIDTGYYTLKLYDQSSSTNLDSSLTNSLLVTEECYVYTDDNANRIFQ
jgi:hypothetical protein